MPECTHDPAPRAEAPVDQVAEVPLPFKFARDLPWLAAALHETGVVELAGGEHNPRIVWYHSHTSLHADTDEVPWCSSFACAMLEEAGWASPRSAAARAWLDWGEPLPAPTLGSVVVLSRSGNRRAWVPGREPQGPGHVGFFLGGTRDLMAVLGGNQSNRVKLSFYPRLRLLGVRWPKGTDRKNRA